MSAVAWMKKTPIVRTERIIVTSLADRGRGLRPVAHRGDALMRKRNRVTRVPRSTGLAGKFVRLDRRNSQALTTL